MQSAVPVDIARDKLLRTLITYGVPTKSDLRAAIGEYDFQKARKFGLDANIRNFRGVLVERSTLMGAQHALLAYRPATSATS